MRSRAIVIALVLVFLVALVGCSSAQPSQPTAQAPTQAAPAPGGTLEGTSWTALTFGVSGEPQPVLSSAPITAEFSADGTMSGSSGVNTYSAPYKTDGGNITIGPEITSTMKAGPEDAMTQEANYITTLKTATRYEIDAKSGQLVLFGQAGNNIARYNPAQ